MEKLMIIFMYIIAMTNAWLVTIMFQMKQELLRLSLDFRLNNDILTKLALESKLKEELNKIELDK